MGKKKKTTTVSLGEFRATIADTQEKQTEVYRPPEQNRSGGGGFGRGGFSDRGRDDEKNGNRKNFEKKEEVFLDFREARNSQPQPQPQIQQQQQPGSQQQQLKPHERFPLYNPRSDNKAISRNQDSTESGARKSYFSNSSSNPVAKIEPTPISQPVVQTEKADVYRPPGMRNQALTPTATVPGSAPLSAPKSSRFENLGKSDKKVEDTRSAFSKIFDSFSRGTDLVTEIFAVNPIPSLRDVVSTILQLTPLQEIYSLNWLTDDGFKPLFQEYVTRNPENRFFLMVECQRFACNSGFPNDKKEGLSLLSAFFYTLYKEDLILESDIARWVADHDFTLKALKSKAIDSCGNFLFWLENVEAED